MKYLIAVLFVFAAQAFAAEPAYWMKQYPGAENIKVQRCLAVANEAYEKAYGGAPWGQNGWGVLAKGNAWEKCMDGK